MIHYKSLNLIGYALRVCLLCLFCWFSGNALSIQARYSRTLKHPGDSIRLNLTVVASPHGQQQTIIIRYQHWFDLDGDGLYLGKREMIYDSVSLKAGSDSVEGTGSGLLDTMMQLGRVPEPCYYVELRVSVVTGTTTNESFLSVSVSPQDTSHKVTKGSKLRWLYDHITLEWAARLIDIKDRIERDYSQIPRECITELCLLDTAQRSTKVILVDSNSVFLNPSISPDRSKCLVEKRTQCSSRVCLVDLATCKVLEETEGPNDVCPKWTFAGDEYLYVSNGRLGVKRMNKSARMIEICDFQIVGIESITVVENSSGLRVIALAKPDTSNTSSKFIGSSTMLALRVESNGSHELLGHAVHSRLWSIENMMSKHKNALYHTQAEICLIGDQSEPLYIRLPGNRKITGVNFFDNKSVVITSLSQ